MPFVKDDKDNVNDVDARGNGALTHAIRCRMHIHTLTRAHVNRARANMYPERENGADAYFFNSLGVCFVERDGGGGGVRTTAIVTVTENEHPVALVRMYLCPRKARVTTNAASYDVSSFIKSKQRLPGHPHSNFHRSIACAGLCVCVFSYVTWICVQIDR